MEEGIYKLGEIDGKSIYHDKYQSEKEFLIGRQSKPSMNPGIIYIPSELLEGLEGTPFDKNEIDKLPKSPIEYDRIKFIIGGSSDLEFYKSILCGFQSQK